MAGYEWFAGETDNVEARGVNMSDLQIGAVILGAGLSSRMGAPKLLLSWGGSTVIGTIIRNIQLAGVQTIVLVTGASHAGLADELQNEAVSLVHNPDFTNGSMVTSLQVGLRQLKLLGMDSALLALGDQPQMQTEVTQKVLVAGREHPGKLILPSYQMKRGHPWMIPGSLWEKIHKLHPGQTMRDFVRSQEENIHYVLVETPSIFADLDTPEDYQRERPEENGV